MRSHQLSCVFNELKNLYAWTKIFVGLAKRCQFSSKLSPFNCAHSRIVNENPHQLSFTVDSAFTNSADSATPYTLVTKVTENKDMIDLICHQLKHESKTTLFNQNFVFENYLSQRFACHRSC